MRYILLALLACSMAGAASAAPDRGRGQGASQSGPTRMAVAPAAASTRGAIARQATSRRPSAQPIGRQSARPFTDRRQGAVSLSRQARGQAARPTGSRYARAQAGRPGIRGGFYQTTARGASRYAATCQRGSRAARCRGERTERRFAWQSGLPQAAGVQTISCPTGTVETPAHGHTTIMRCLPL